MDIDTHLEQIPQSQSDLLLRAWGYDLVREYFSIAQQLPQNSAPVVELATGTGRMSAVLSCIFPSIISGDISFSDLPRVLQRIPKPNIGRVHFLQLNMENLPFRTDSIPLLVCMNTLHEVSNPYLCLLEMIRVIRPDGSLVIGDFNRTGFDAMQKIHQTVYHNDHQEGLISLDEIERLLSSSFHTVRSFSTPLNVTYIASNKQ